MRNAELVSFLSPGAPHTPGSPQHQACSQRAGQPTACPAPCSHPVCRGPAFSHPLAAHLGQELLRVAAGVAKAWPRAAVSVCGCERRSRIHTAGTARSTSVWLRSPRHHPPPRSTCAAVSLLNPRAAQTLRLPGAVGSAAALLPAVLVLQTRCPSAFPVLAEAGLCLPVAGGEG